MQGRANSQRGHYAQHAPASMKEWHSGTDTLPLLNVPAQGEDSAVIEDGALRLDGPFGEAGGARGVEDLRGVGWLHRYLSLVQRVRAHLFASRDHLAKEGRPPALLLKQSCG